MQESRAEVLAEYKGTSPVDEGIDDVRMMQSTIATLWSYLDVFSWALLEVFCPGGRIIVMQGVVGEGGSC